MKHNRRQRAIAFGVALMAVVASLAIVNTAMADTQYFPDGNGWGKTYRNNYRSSGCYDQYGSYSSCYQGTWAETFYYLDYLSVYETPQKSIPTLPGNYGGPFYWYQKSAIQNLCIPIFLFPRTTMPTSIIVLMLEPGRLTET